MTIHLPGSRRLWACIAVLAIAFTAVACSNNQNSADDDVQRRGQDVVNAYGAKAQASVKYPLDQMNTFLELENQREKLLRFNNPAKIGYVYIFNQGVKEPIGYYTVRGKVSSTDSQMTPPQQVYWTCKNNHGCQPVVVDSPSDDGSFGPNEQGYFFFTSEDVYVFVPEQMSPLYMDAPIKVYNVPQLNSSDQKPTSVGESQETRDKNRLQGEKDAKEAQRNAQTNTTKP